MYMMKASTACVVQDKNTTKVADNDDFYIIE